MAPLRSGACAAFLATHFLTLPARRLQPQSLPYLKPNALDVTAAAR
jgi:hypothetical protein